MRHLIALALNICFVPVIVTGIWWQLTTAAFVYGRKKAHAVAEWMEGDR